ncbi:hydantoinase/oxoprolinase family protein [Paenibacillaceae bacterium WGS1546]|uniref:hydantoinase/oxoprolinase family protein n=1 Tax=Cohnella sp. WGS1546 TaxID=3366810 RepID=UPI00372CF7E0
MLKIKLGIDVGGTFTDIVAIDDDGRVSYTKTPSTPEDQSIGVANGIRRMLEDLGIKPENVTAVAHGTTVATNTLLERSGAKTALITTEGFRDVLHIGRQSRPQLYDLRALRPEPLVERKWRKEAIERTLHTGEILKPLNEEALRATVRELVDEGVESIAVCFLHSYANSTNEERALAIIKSEAPHLPVSVSTDILPEFREFERMNTTVLNAYVQPGMENYVSRLSERIKDLGVDGPLTIMQSSGGMMTDRVAASRSVHTLLSGPAGGVLAAQFLADAAKEPNLITADLGGTSFDVSVVENGEFVTRTEGVIEGYPVKFPHIDIHTIGAGGGSIAWIDAGGALRVGPRSSGAQPGPVCYGRGGVNPTVTDAHAVLGRVGAALSGGELRLDIEAAREAIRVKLAEPLGLTVEAAAEGILRVVNSSMVRAIRVMTVERGIDPRKFTILPFGGAGALHGAELARSLGVEKVLVPVASGNFSAFGLLAAPIRYDEVSTYQVHENQVELAKLAGILEKLEAAGRAQMRRDGIVTDAAIVDRRADIRYYGQAYELTVPFPDGPVTPEAWRRIIGSFHQAHEQTYGFQKKGDPVELVNLRVSILSSKEPPKLSERAFQAAGSLKPASTRPAYFNGTWMDTPIYNHDDLRPGHTFTGPAVIEEKGATTVMGPGDIATVDNRLNMVIQVASVHQSIELSDKSTAGGR